MSFDSHPGGEPTFGVAEHAVLEFDKEFSDATFKKKVQDAAKSVDINPGLLGATLLSETTRKYYLSKKPSVDGYPIGTDTFWEKRNTIAARIPACKIHITGHYTQVTEQGMRPRLQTSRARISCSQVPAT